jgi:hypothetical protein
VKLRGRPKAPDGAEGAQFLSARGANPQACHGPLQRLLEDAFIEATVRARSLACKPAVHGIRLSAPPGGERSHGRCSINDFLFRRAPRSQATAVRARTRLPQTKGLCLGSQLSPLSQISRTWVRTLTVKLRGRPKAPDGAAGAQSPTARGANPQACHGPLQRLLDGSSTDILPTLPRLHRRPFVRMPVLHCLYDYWADVPHPSRISHGSPGKHRLVDVNR